MESSRELHPLLSLISACFSVIFWLLTWVKATIAFLAFSLPRWIYAILSYSFTLTLNFYALALLFCVSAIFLSILIRFRYLSKYSTLRELPLGKPTALELHPDVNKSEEPNAFHNYLDEFLQAVRVFGFLEKPVFHELARHLQTRRLIAGDTMSLDADKSFYCVVDGNVQVFAPPSNKMDLDNDGGEHWGEEMNGYQLLNEVGSGGMLSSLFTILSLFTEDVQLHWTDQGASAAPVSDPTSGASSPGPSSRGRVDSDVSRMDLGSTVPGTFSPRKVASPSVKSSISSSTDTIQNTTDPTTLNTRLNTSDDPPGTDWDPQTWSPPSESEPGTPQYDSTRKSTGYFTPNDSRRSNVPPTQSPLQQGTIARAAVDTTLAVIPAEAFKRLTQKFPKASAHIVQVILTRFSRVTFQSAHRYLGLTTELLRTEKAINDIACHPLPRLFYEGGGIENLRQRFMHSGSVNGDEPDASEDSEDYFSQSNEDSLTNLMTERGIDEASLRRQNERSVKGSVSLSSTSTTIAPSRDRITLSTRRKTPQTRNQYSSPSAASTVPGKSPITPFRPTPSRISVNAGDLHTSTGGLAEGLPRQWPNSTPHLSRRMSSTPSMMREASRMQSEDFDLREEVMSCIAKSIGLLQPPLSNSMGSAQPSPMPFSNSLNPTPDQIPASGRASAMFNSSFSSLLQGNDAASSMSSSVRSSTLNSSYMSGLDNEVEILSFPAGSLLVKAGEKNAGLFYVIDGLLDVSMPADDTQLNSIIGAERPMPPKRPSSRDQTSNVGRSPSSIPADSSLKTAKHLFNVKPGGIAGYLASLSGIPSYVDIRAKTDVYVGLLPTHSLERLLEKRPIVLLTLAKRLISLLSPLVLHIDASLDWIQLNAGQVLWRPGDKSDSFYIVINGRLRALMDQENGDVCIVGEYGQGDAAVGELDVITSQPRKTTVHAIRDTELVRLPMTLFNAISVRHPQTTVQLLRMIASRVRDEVGNVSSGAKLPGSINIRAGANGGNNLNLKTVAIIPAAKNVPVDAFAKRLQSALEENGAPTSFLNQGAVMRHLGKHAFTRMGKLKVAGWLADQEQRYRIVLYVADSPVSSPWTQTCIRQADCILVVGFGDEPSLGEYERLLMAAKTTARKELVLLHPDRSVIPGTTRRWLKNRPWIHAHFHVELPGIEVHNPAPVLHDPAAMVAFKKVKDRVQSELQKYRGGPSAPRPRRPPQMSDFARLARHLCGKSIGLVLGGGGARGLSHLGMIRAMEERGIPIDRIGGTSIGALIGGLYAEEADIISSVARAKHFGGRMGSLWRLATDLTWPVVAYTTGHEFNRSLYKVFYDAHIEDMWLPFFCNSTNILDSRMEIHDSGYAWRYIRASMTLVGLLPPISDNGKVLVDGGYVDNLPVASMISMGANTVFAVDVGSLDDNSPRNFGDTVSGFWMLLNRWNPFSAARSVPAITEIQSRLAYVSSVRTLEEAKVTPGCLYVAMPVQDYGTLQFGKYEELAEIGYRFGKQSLQKWDSEGRLPSGVVEGTERAKRRGRGLRRNSI